MSRTHGKKQNVTAKMGAFSLTFVLLFAITYGFLAVVDVLPDPVRSDASNGTEPARSLKVSQGAAEAPVRIEAKNIGLDVAVSNPTSTDVEVLDQALLKGAVRYPTSAMLGANGTVFLFGHSSYLPIVHNQAYKAFNKIQNLTKGQIVSVYSGSTEYRYKVVNVRVADATEDVVELSATGKLLVLVTCDSFKSKNSRFVVTADFVGTYSLTN